MADVFQFGKNAVRALAKSQQRTRADSHSPQPLGAVTAVRQQRKTTAIGVAQEDIARHANILLIDPGFLKSGKVRLLFAQADGSVRHSSEFVVAFNFTDAAIQTGELVTMILDWQTGKWVIIGSLGFARRLYFKGSVSFGIGDPSFAARLVNYFDGFDPRGTTWSLSGDDTVHNPPTESGEYFFSGASGDYGFALWHEADAITPGSPAGYWCYQKQCVPT